MGVKKTHEQYLKDVEKINPNIEVLGIYVNAYTKILHRCKIDGYEWYTKPNSILSGYGCPKCGGVARYNHETYVNSLSKINNNIKVLDKYINITTPILHQCLVCGHKWTVSPRSLLDGHNCPVCSGNIIGDYPDYKNSIWSKQDYRELFGNYITEEQMKSYMPNTNTKIDMRCPNCGRHKLVAPQTISQYGFSCICSDGISYPNKFMFSLLEQIGVDFISEYCPKWSNGKRYDFYIQNINTIIECHGKQHYIGWSGDKNNAISQQENDNYKMQLAFNNGIVNYIIIDCRKSDINFIKSNILNSKLLKLTHTDKDAINWLECDKFASNSIINLISEMWDSGSSIKEIRAKTKLCDITISKYIKYGNKLGICNIEYSTSEAHKRGALHGINSPNSSSVYCIELNKVYATQKQARIETGATHISACCLGKRNVSNEKHWYYLYDKIMKNGNVVKGAITLGLISEEEAMKQLDD